MELYQIILLSILIATYIMFAWVLSKRTFVDRADVASDGEMFVVFVVTAPVAIVVAIVGQALIFFDFLKRKICRRNGRNSN